MASQSFYAVLTADGKYFGGFNTEKQKPDFVDTPFEAKLFTNKYDIKLRPTEMIVELKAQMDPTNTEISEPFRPRRQIR